ncbi:MAG: hypothetical protein Q4E71_02180, partial [Prevotella sp.]|nr:hypothetical protein [Prevotella sp.]
EGTEITPLKDLLNEFCNTISLQKSGKLYGSANAPGLSRNTTVAQHQWQSIRLTPMVLRQPILLLPREGHTKVNGNCCNQI